MEIIHKYIEEYSAVINGKPDKSKVEDLIEIYPIRDEVYLLWLSESGGGPIGSDWYDSVDELPESQSRFKKEGWNLSGFVIGWDGAGNPLVLEESGRIVSEDHNFGGMHKIAASFKDLLEANVSN